MLWSPPAPNPVVAKSLITSRAFLFDFADQFPQSFRVRTGFVLIGPLNLAQRRENSGAWQ